MTQAINIQHAITVRHVNSNSTCNKIIRVCAFVTVVGFNCAPSSMRTIFYVEMDWHDAGNEDTTRNHSLSREFGFKVR